MRTEKFWRQLKQGRVHTHQHCCAGPQQNTGSIGPFPLLEPGSAGTRRCKDGDEVEGTQNKAIKVCGNIL